MSTAKGAIEGAEEEGACGGKEGMPKDEVETGVVSSADAKMLELAGTVVVLSPKGFLKDTVFPDMLVKAALPGLAEGKKEATATLLSRPVELVCADEVD